MVRLIKGNEAVVVGALYAGCDAFFGYPITPASEITHAAAQWFPPLGRVFLQAECETDSINMVYGAGAGGKQALNEASSKEAGAAGDQGAHEAEAVSTPCALAAQAASARRWILALWRTSTGKRG